MSKHPIIYSVPHASSNFGVYSDRVNLSHEQRIRYSDYGTDQTVPGNGEVIIAEYSRGLGDLNRSPHDSTLFRDTDFAKPEGNKIWTQEAPLSDEEKHRLINTVYKPYHNKLTSLIKNLQSPGLVIDWHNTAHYIFGNEPDGTPAMMKPVILSNICDEDNGPTCSMKLLEKVKEYLETELRERGMLHEIYLNYVYTGGYITCHYNTTRTPDLHSLPIQSFQVEYDTLLTHDQETLEADQEAIQNLKLAFERTMDMIFAEEEDLIMKF